jgi:hypothetical protein
MVYVYVLQLEKGKYYVGKSDNPNIRIDNHFNCGGSEWTKMYKPIRVVNIKSGCDNYDEDKITKQYMDKYGINNVRGGSFVTIKLEKSEIDVLKKMNCGTHNKCFKCGKGGHYATNCKTNSKNIYKKKEYECFRCGREGHIVSSCYASKHVGGYYLKDNYYYDSSDDSSDDSGDDSRDDRSY